MAKRVTKFIKGLLGVPSPEESEDGRPADELQNSSNDEIEEKLPKHYGLFANEFQNSSNDKTVEEIMPETYATEPADTEDLSGQKTIIFENTYKEEITGIVGKGACHKGSSGVPTPEEGEEDGCSADELQNSSNDEIVEEIMP